MPIIDKKQWRKLLEKAIRGDAESQYEVGCYYEEGITNHSGETVIQSQPLRALHWYTLSAKKGNDSAQNSLGRLLSTGEGVDRNIKEAIYWTKQALRQGSPCAAFNLGTIYRDVGKPTLAFRWYNRAVEMGDHGALLQVGLCYFFGFGVKKDLKKAYRCFKRITTYKPRLEVSERTGENALYWMAIFHLLGIGGAKRSVKTARNLLESADKDGDHEQANELLNLIGKTKYMLA